MLLINHLNTEEGGVVINTSSSTSFSPNDINGTAIYEVYVYDMPLLEQVLILLLVDHLPTQ